MDEKENLVLVNHQPAVDLDYQPELTGTAVTQGNLLELIQAANNPKKLQALYEARDNGWQALLDFENERLKLTDYRSTQPQHFEEAFAAPLDEGAFKVKGKKMKMLVIFLLNYFSFLFFRN